MSREVRRTGFAFLVLVALAGPPDAESIEVPRSLVSLSPAVTDILRGVGAFDRVVGVTDDCELPVEAKPMTRVGGWLDISLERVASLRPDLVIMADFQSAFYGERLSALGFPTLVVPSQSLEDVFHAISEIGRAVGTEEAGRELASEVRIGLDRIAERHRLGPRPRVLFVVDRVPGSLRDLYVAGKGSFLFSLVTIAGGQPVSPRVEASYLKIATETVIALDPEVILDLVKSVSPSPGVLTWPIGLAEDPREVWRVLSPVSAVRHDRVYALRDAFLVHPSQRVLDTARVIERILHPAPGRP